MKKLYILAIAIFAFTANAQVEVEDSFDFYNLGDISPQATFWRTWAEPGTTDDDADVVDTESQSPDQSLYIDDSGVQDMILLVESVPTSGLYSIQFAYLIPEGKEGYYNMQGAMTPNSDPWNQRLNGGNVFYNEDGAAPGVGTVDATPGQTFAFPHDEWFTVTMVYDLDNQMWALYINGVLQFDDQTFEFNDPFVELAGINFYSISAGNETYLDDLVLYSGDITTLATESFEAKGFATAVSNGILTLRANEAIDTVIIYNMLGQEVYNTNIGSLRSTIDMSSFASGAYIIKASINGTVGSVKVIK